MKFLFLILYFSVLRFPSIWRFHINLEFFIIIFSYKYISMFIITILMSLSVNFNVLVICVYDILVYYLALRVIFSCVFACLANLILYWELRNTYFIDSGFFYFPLNNTEFCQNRQWNYWQIMSIMWLLSFSIFRTDLI